MWHGWHRDQRSPRSYWILEWMPFLGEGRRSVSSDDQKGNVASLTSPWPMWFVIPQVYPTIHGRYFDVFSNFLQHFIRITYAMSRYLHYCNKCGKGFAKKWNMRRHSTSYCYSESTKRSVSMHSSFYMDYQCQQPPDQPAQFSFHEHILILWIKAQRSRPFPLRQICVEYWRLLAIVHISH